jgi:hypothetical protein
MTRANERERGLDAQPWAAALLPRFAWLAARWPWFAAPVAFHAWPWIGRMGVWASAAIGVAVMGHAWIGGRAWQRIETTRPSETPEAASANARGKTHAEADGTTSSLFQDEVLSDAPLSTGDARLLRLHDGLSATALQMLRYVPTVKDGTSIRSGEGEGAGRDFREGDRTGREDASSASIRWADVLEADLLAAIAAGTRADAALPGLRSRARAAGVVMPDGAAADTARHVPGGEISPDARPSEDGRARGSERARSEDSARVGGAGGVVTQWAQWLSEMAKRYDVVIDRFAVDDRPIARAHHHDGSDDVSDIAVDRRGDDVNEGGASDAGSFPRRAEASEADFTNATAEREVPRRAAHIAVRGAFEPMSAFIAAMGATSPPLLIQAAQIMPDHDSNGSRLALQAVLFFVEPDKPRIAERGVGVSMDAAGRPSAGTDPRSGRAALPALRLPASDAAPPANPFRRRGHAQTDIVVLATFASGGQRAVLLARHPGGDGMRGIASDAMAMRSDPRETALARPGETFADVRVVEIEADHVRLRPLLGGKDLVVRLAREVAIDYSRGAR